MVYGLWISRGTSPGGANQKTCSVWPGVKVSLKGYVFRIHTRRGGGRSPTPRGANQGIVTGGKERGVWGFVPGGVSPRASPQVRRCV